jgi:DNA-binding CsgD family transcriptional regulator
MTLVIHHAGPQMIGIAANRALSDFTERERTCLAALRPHVVQSRGKSNDNVARIVGATSATVKKAPRKYL